MSHEGQLVGLVTVKDVLRHEATLAHKESKFPASPPQNHARTDSVTSSNGRQDGWVDMNPEEDGTHGLEVALEEALAWVRIRGSRAYSVVDGLMQRARGRPRGAERHETAYEFEMAEENRDSG